MEKAIYWFTKNHVAANFLMLVILLVGMSTWFTLRKEIFPETSVDVIAISVPYPNASPEEVEKGVVVPIEESVEGVDGIDRVRSTASQNVGVISVEVSSGANIREVMDDVKTRVDAITNLAEGAEEPVLQEVILKGRVLSIAVSANTDERSLREMSEQVRDELLAYEYVPSSTKIPVASFFQAFVRKVTGTAGPFQISTIELTSARPYEVAIEVSEDRLRELGITMTEVANAVAASSIDLPGGSIRADGGEIVLRTESRKYDAAGFEGISLLTRPDGSRVTVADVAVVKDGFEEVDVESRFDGKRSMLLGVFRTGEEDTLRLAAAANEFISTRAVEILPEGVELEVWADESIYLDGRMNLLIKNGIVGLLLVLLVLALFLRPSLALLVTIGIPVSFAGAVMTMPETGISINMISLFAFILVLGIVVDDAIVVAENVYRRMRNGEDPRTAAPEGTHEVGVVVTFGVLTTAVAFTPMLGLSGVSGKIWPNIPLIVIPVLLFSLVQSKLILPAHLACLKRSDPNAKPGRIIRFQRIFSHGLERFVEKVYRPIARVCLMNRYLVVVAFVSLFFVMVGAVGTGWIKFQFFPEVEADIVTAKLEMPAGVPFEKTQAAVAQIERGADELGELLQTPDGESIIAHRLASSGTQPYQIGFDALGGTPIATNLGEVTIELKSSTERGISAVEVASKWRELTGTIPGVAQLTFASQSAAGGNAIDLELVGSNDHEVEAAAQMVKDALANYNGVIDISSSDRSGKRQLKLGITPQGEALGLRLGDVANQVRQGFYGEEVQRLQRGRDEVKVMVRYPRSEREVLSSLEEMKIRTQQGAEVPFASVATATYGRSYATISRSDRRRAITVVADVDKSKGVNSNEVVAALEADTFPKILSRYPSVTFGFQGEQKDQAQSVQEIFQGMILALVVMYILMAIPLKSYVQPLIVMSVIPFGIVGAVIGHVIMRTELSIMSMCGIVALAGVVVNDSLVLVDYVNRQRAKGLSLIEATWEAGAARFRPILLTSLTTFAGLTPMLLETDIQALFLVPMAISLSFGILFATSITLILVPCVYLILNDVISGLRWLKAKWKGEKTLSIS